MKPDNPARAPSVAPGEQPPVPALPLSGTFDIVLEQTRLIARSAAIRALLKLVVQIGKSSASVLITGETGCGKDLIAHAVHHFSARNGKPFVNLNCASIPEHLIESELFGYEKGAFSGADTMKPGLFEVADSGILFLDEIGELDLKLQAKLLRVLDGAGYYRLGGQRKVNVDVRIVAATNQNVETLILNGKFRKDLYHRLAQFEVNVPPLRERPDDIVAIAEHLLHSHCPESLFTPDAITALQNYSWPGNVRELRNVLLKTILVTPNATSEVRACDLPPAVRRQASTPGFSVLGMTLSELEKRAIQETVAAFGDNLNRAAEELGVSRRTLERKLKAYARARKATLATSMQPEQQRKFRAAVEIPIQLRSSLSFLVGTTINISYLGVGIQLKEIPQENNFLVVFELPQCPIPIEADAELAWSDPNCRCGILFTHMAPECHTALQDWLLKRMRQEGWTLASRATQSRG